MNAPIEVEDMTTNYRLVCPRCGGRGTASGLHGLTYVICGKCGGDGYIEPANVVHGQFITRHDVQQEVKSLETISSRA